MDGKFERKSPAQFSEKVGIPIGWFVISPRWVVSKKDRRLNHGKWYKIESNDGCVYRVLRFSANLSGSPKSGNGVIVLDWLGWLMLDGYAEDVSNKINLKITKVGWWMYPWMIIKHPDPAYCLAGGLAILSLLLAMLSLIIGLR